MRRIVIALMASFVWFPAMLKADNYTALWKQWETAVNKDLPQSQIDILNQIITKSTAEKAYGHLVKAQLCRMTAVSAVSPDSLVVEAEKLNELAETVREQALKAVYYTALGRCYSAMALQDTIYKSKSKQCYDLAMKHPDALAKQTGRGMEPLVVKGMDSRIFRDDLLHVIGMECGAYSLLHQYYRTHGNRRAACITAAIEWDRKLNLQQPIRSKKSKQLQSIDSLINEYQDLQEAGELAILHARCLEVATDTKEGDLYHYINYALSKWGTWPRMNRLRNMQSEITNPTFNISLGSCMLRPGEARTVRINSIRNIDEITLNVYRLTQPCNQNFYKIKGGITTLRRTMERTPVQTLTLKYYGQPTYKISSDTTVISGLPIGSYVVEAVTSNRTVPAQYEVLHVTGLALVWQSLPDKNARVVVVDATTGAPVAGAKVDLLDHSCKPILTLTTDAKGEASCRKPKDCAHLRAYTDTDRYAPYLQHLGWFSYGENSSKAKDITNLFTDRAIYRPGQTVHVSLIAHKRYDKIRTEALEGKTVKVQLRDPNYKVVAEKQVTTDSFGTAAVDFALPATELMGYYSVRADNRMVTSFRVEAYKRPTFLIEFDEVKEKYENGDTVTLSGRVKSYAGVPVQGAKVDYTVMRNLATWWWYRSFGDRAESMAKGDVTTDANGVFRVKVPVVLPDNIRDNQKRFYNFETSVTVTDISGESHSASSVLPLGTHPTALSCNLPDKILADSLQAIRFTYTNSAGKEIPGQVSYQVDGVAYQAEANQEIDIRAIAATLKSGEHTMQVVCGSDTLKQKFVVFSLTDERCVTRTHDWFYVSDRQFSADGKPVSVQLGASDERLHVLYTILAGKQIVEQGSLDLEGKLHNRQFVYKPEYDDGLSLSYAWVKEGRLYRHDVTIARPVPDKRLLTTWTTFRDRLTPGQKEEWTLRICRPDGTPATAQLMATLYDKSLDALCAHKWRFVMSYRPIVNSLCWLGDHYQVLGLYGYMAINRLAENDLDFSHFDERCFPMFGRKERMMLTAAPAMATAKMSLKESKVASLNSGSFVGSRFAVETFDDCGAVATGGNEAEVTESMSVRENLNETAFFYPNLSTNANGEVTIRFVLPESVTTWRFMGLAHDKDMNVGFAYGEAVAQKTVMVQPNMPRFLRQGDKGTIVAKLSNTSAKTVRGTATIELTDADTQKMVYSQHKEFTIDANGTAAVTFDYTPATADQLLICKVMAKGRDFSDGEQHYLPVLPDKEQVTNTVPFTQHGAGTYTVDLDKLFPAKGKQKKLTVEYTDNPAWLMVQALPSIAQPNTDNAVSLVAAYYANSIAASLLGQSPVIKQTLQRWQQEQGKESSLASSLEKNQELKTIVMEETPWVMDAQRESDRKRQLINYFDSNQLQAAQQSTFDKLAKLQRADGSFSWCPGMEGNIYMTVTVAETLARLHRLTGHTADTGSMLDRAIGYADKWVANYVAELKKEEKKGNKQLVPSETACHYLYARALAGKKASADVAYLITLLEKQPRKYSIYGKANTAVILALHGRTAKAAEYLQSVREYTVYHEEMGRYFDTPKAAYSWMDYRIPTQTAAIEAMQLLTPQDSQTIEEMQRWLLQEKRTQCWDTPINSVDAVYAFFNGRMDKLSAVSTSPVQLRVDGRRIETSRPTAALGYVKGQVSGDKMRTFTAEKTSEGTSWGAVYAQSILPTTEVCHATAGLSVKREVIGSGKTLKIGDRVKVRVTIHADRDYDFVQVVDKRAACLEPVIPLSGYRQGYYCMLRDHSTNYYFDKMAKGKHVIETEYYVDRAGEYQAGTCVAQCAYSPEYMGRDAGMKLTTEKK